MRLVFENPRLALIRTARAHVLGLPPHIVEAACDKLDFIESAPDERSLRNWRSLRYKKLEGYSDGRHQIRINDQYRIALRIDGDPPVATILDIGDPH